MLKVFALKYGERQTTACQFFFREGSHEPVTLHFFVWLILGGPYPVLVDTGFRQEDAAERGIANFVSPAAMVEKLGVKAADIPTALITHLHWDHWAGHSLSRPPSSGSRRRRSRSGRGRSRATTPTRSSPAPPRWPRWSG